MCMGLLDKLVANIEEYGGESIAFICIEYCCTEGGGQGVNKAAFQQLFQMVKQFCESVKMLTAQVTNLATARKPPETAGAPPTE